MDQINLQNFDKLLESLGEAEVAPTMFIAYCYTCCDVRDFEFGRCLNCKDIWKLLVDYMKKNKSTA